MNRQQITKAKELYDEMEFLENLFRKIKEPTDSLSISVIVSDRRYQKDITQYVSMSKLFENAIENLRWEIGKIQLELKKLNGEQITTLQANKE